MTLHICHCCTLLIGCLPVIQDLWNLSPHVIGSVGAEGAGLEGEIGPVRTSDLGHPSVSVQCPQADVILQAHGVLHSFLQRKTQVHIQNSSSQHFANVLHPKQDHNTSMFTSFTQHKAKVLKLHKKIS